MGRSDVEPADVRAELKQGQLKRLQRKMSWSRLSEHKGRQVRDCMRTKVRDPPTKARYPANKI